MNRYDTARKMLSYIFLTEHLLKTEDLALETRRRGEEHLMEFKREYRKALKKANEAPLQEVVSANDDEVVYREWVKQDLDSWTESERIMYICDLFNQGQPNTEFSPSGRMFIKWNTLVRFPNRGWAYYECKAVDC